MPSPLTIAQLARAVGMSIEDVGSYRDRGLLPPPRRVRGREGDVAFYQDHAERLRFIQRALELEFPLEDIARLVDPQILVTSGDVRELARGHLARLHQDPARWQDAIATLSRLIAACPGTGRRQECAILAYLNGKPGG